MRRKSNVQQTVYALFQNEGQNGYFVLSGIHSFFYRDDSGLSVFRVVDCDIDVLFVEFVKQVGK